MEDNDANNKLDEGNNEIEIKRQGKFKFSEITIDVVKFWLFRANRLKKIRSQIAGMMQLQKVENKCEFCEKNWGLRSECLENLEDLFEKFLKGNKYQNVHDISKWQNYFFKHAKLRTICFLCSEEILSNKKAKLQNLDTKKKPSIIKPKKISFIFLDGNNKQLIKKVLKLWRDKSKNKDAVNDF